MLKKKADRAVKRDKPQEKKKKKEVSEEAKLEKINRTETLVRKRVITPV